MIKSIWVSFLDEDQENEEFNSNSGEAFREKPVQGPLVWQSSFEEYISASDYKLLEQEKNQLSENFLRLLSSYKILQEDLLNATKKNEV